MTKTFGTWALRLTGENLTDADYAFRPGYPMPGRSVLSGVAWGF